MSDPHSIKNKFLEKITVIIENHMSDEQFGVSELAREVGMSRSNLLRKLKRVADVSVSQYIREVRLRNSMELLKEKDYTISETSYKVGFSSTSYFIKCFREYYGYPPGQVGKRENDKEDNIQMGSQTQPHKLVAIMFTDIEGYTALMQHDEKKALEYINRHRKVFNSITKKFHGRILQFYGDGTLSTFTSAIDAVNCGVEMQLGFREDPGIPVRIGIHSGDIIFNKNGIIGDGVNVASRIESLAVAGSVFISGKVYDEVKNQSGIHTISLGTFELKNVDKPMDVYAITNPGLNVPRRDQITGKTKKTSSDSILDSKSKNIWSGIKWAFIPLAMMILGFLVYNSGIFDKNLKAGSDLDPSLTGKSIAVLPFINDSSDSSNVYIINGLMEAILNNLQKIEDLRVISRTSVENYRNTTKIISDIAEELNVRYFVEGSGQKIGDQILLSIQLIDANSDQHLWSQQYNRELNDIFNLQREIAVDIATNIEAIITPEEEERLNKVPTKDLVAYDYFLKGQDFIFKGTTEGLEASIPFFRLAIQEDEGFAHAYADVAIAYFFLDALQTEKKYLDSINKYADQALLLDPQLPQSLVAKALFYLNNKEYDLALPYLETALEYHPNNVMVLNILSDFYTSYSPNTEKYLEVALKVIPLDIAAQDSVSASFSYLHVSNALIQTGFVGEAERYINKSISYDPNNLFSEYLKAYILFAGNRNIRVMNQSLIKTLSRDTTRADIVQEVAKSYYYLRDYESAQKYYQWFLEIKAAYNLDVFNGEFAKIALVYSEVGETEKSEEYMQAHKAYADQDKSIYKHLSLAVYYSFRGETSQAMDEMRLFSKEENYHYWTLIFLKIDPLLDDIIDLPEFKQLLHNMESRFWSKHNAIKEMLQEDGVM